CGTRRLRSPGRTRGRPGPGYLIRKGRRERTQDDQMLAGLADCCLGAQPLSTEPGESDDVQSQVGGARDDLWESGRRAPPPNLKQCQRRELQLGVALHKCEGCVRDLPPAAVD